MTATALVRIPAMISGSATGSSTRQSCWRPFMPIPLAASRSSGSTSATPTYVLVRIGGIASVTSATNVGMEPIPTPRKSAGGSLMPNASTASRRIARLGSARPMFDTLTATNPPLRACPSTSPIGSATSTATTSEIAEIARCWRTRCGMPSFPVQWSPLANQSNTSPRKLTRSPWRARSALCCRRATSESCSARSRDAPGAPGPWCRESLEPEQRRVHDNRERDHEHARDRDRCAERALEPVEHHGPEPALPDERCDRNEPDQRDRSDPDTGDDRRHRERQLDAKQLSRPRVAHALRRLDDLGRDGVETGHDVADQDQQRVGGQGDQGRLA